MKRLVFSSLPLFLLISLEAGRVNVRSCTAIPGSASGPNTQGGDAFCGSQRQPSPTAFRSAKKNAPAKSKPTDTIIIEDNKPLTRPTAALLTLPSLGQKKIIQFTPSQGIFNSITCSLIVELIALTTKEREQLPPADQDALYRVSVSRATTQSPSLIVPIANIYLSQLPAAAESQVMLLIQPDGKSYAAQGVVSLPTDLASADFKKI